MSSHESIVTVATFAMSLEASLAKGALEVSGIRAVVRNEGGSALSRGIAAPYRSSSFRFSRPTATVSSSLCGDWISKS
jgi:hypothetical protein